MTRWISGVKIPRFRGHPNRRENARGVIHGESGRRRTFTPEFKAEAVRLCKVGDRNRRRRWRKDLDLTETALREWVKRAEVDAGKGPPGALTTDEREELTRAAAREQAARDGARDLKKSGGLLREGERREVRVHPRGEGAATRSSVLCDVLDVSRSGFYAWRARPPRRGRTDDAQLAVEIAAAHKRSRGTYGSPRVHARAARQGRRVGKKRVERLMRENGIQGAAEAPLPTTTDSKHPNPIAPNVLDARLRRRARRTTAWVTDVTYVWTRRGLALPRRDARPVLASRRRLGDEREQRHARSRSTRFERAVARRTAGAASCTTPTAAAPTPATTTATRSTRTASSRA